MRIFSYLMVVLFVLAVTTVSMGQDPNYTKETPIGYIQETEIEVTDTAQAITPLSNRLFISIINLDDDDYMWLSVGTTTAEVGAGIPVPPKKQFKATIGDGVPVGIIASITASATVDQGY